MNYVDPSGHRGISSTFTAWQLNTAYANNKMAIGGLTLYNNLLNVGGIVGGLAAAVLEGIYKRDWKEGAAIGVALGISTYAASMAVSDRIDKRKEFSRLILETQKVIGFHKASEVKLAPKFDDHGKMLGMRITGVDADGNNFEDFVEGQFDLDLLNNAQSHKL